MAKRCYRPEEVMNTLRKAEALLRRVSQFCEDSTCGLLGRNRFGNNTRVGLMCYAPIVLEGSGLRLQPSGMVFCS